MLRLPGVFLRVRCLEHAIRSAEFCRQTFIVKVWIEPSQDGKKGMPWRGRITHVLSGEEKNVEDLEATTEFIGRYLKECGARTQLHRSAAGWLRLFSCRG